MAGGRFRHGGSAARTTARHGRKQEEKKRGTCTGTRRSGEKTTGAEKVISDQPHGDERSSRNTSEASLPLSIVTRYMSPRTTCHPPLCILAMYLLVLSGCKANTIVQTHGHIPLARDDAAALPVHPHRRAAVVPHRAHHVLHLVQPALRGEERQVCIVPDKTGNKKRQKNGISTGTAIV